MRSVDALASSDGATDPKENPPSTAPPPTAPPPTAAANVVGPAAVAAPSISVPARSLEADSFAGGEIDLSWLNRPRFPAAGTWLPEDLIADEVAPRLSGASNLTSAAGFDAGSAGLGSNRNTKLWAGSEEGWERWSSG